ncbi:MAG TPA: hypothetical protein DIW17_01675 [Clostridiales bacterium]|nr:hypothetical protein [Clostridiales bacterium]
MTMNNIMTYKTPAGEWMEGLPIGNGRLAAMVWGDYKSDILTLNHEWLWRGVQRNRKPYEGAKYLTEIRDLLKNKEYFKATSMANTFLGGEGGISNIKSRVDAYQVAGELIFIIDNVNDYLKRELDICTGVSSTVRNAGKTKITSEFFADCVSELLISSWTTDKDFSGDLVFQRVKDNDAVYKYIIKNNRLEFHCIFNGGIEYKVRVDVFTDGNIKALDNGFRVEQASYIKALTNIATSVKDMEFELRKYQIQFDEIDEAESEIQKCLNAYKDNHIDKFNKLMNKIEFSLEEDCCSDDEMTIDERIQNVKDGLLDNGICKLYFDYGRYLLLSSSICGELPANLQGKWNDSINPPWDCDYHFNINLQMNYWMAEHCNMPECAEKLINYVKSFMKSGREAALKLYGCRGIYLPLQTDAWGISTPESFGWSAWIGAAPWIAQHLWWHYIYSGDKEYLKNTAYEFFVEVTAFYEDYLVEDDDGILQIMPSQSPENRFHGTGHFPVSIGVSSAMDVQLAYDALNYAVQSAEILKVDEEKIIKWKQMQSKLPAFKIGNDGRLLEWNEEMDEVEPGHRHMSHLYGLYPSDLFTPEKRSAQYNAAIKSLESRLSHGGGHTGWSRAWVSCLFARIGDSNRFFEHFTALIKDFATISLLDLHPPGIFQIDGNLGAVSAVIEAIIGYYDGKAHLLRALPEQWKDGYLNGVKLPGGHIVNVEWENKKIRALSVKIGFEEKVVLKYKDEEITIEGKAGEIVCVL